MKHFLVITLSFFLSLNAYNQDIIHYYSSDFGVIDNEDNAKFKREIIHRKLSSKKLVITYTLEDQNWEKQKKEIIKSINDTLIQIKRPGDRIWREKVMRSYFQEENDNFKFTDRLNGVILLEGTASNILPLHKQGTIKSYYKKDSPRSIAVYDANKLISNENWLKNGSKYFSDIHFFVDEVPEHSNGQVHFRAYIVNGIRESGIDLNQIADRVMIGWVVMENGDLTGFHTLSGVYGPLNNTLIKLLKEMPGEWIPAKNNGKTVRYYMNMPFNFIDRSESFESLDLSSGFVVWD